LGAECNLVEAEVQLFADNLAGWVKPEPKATNLLNQPAGQGVGCVPPAPSYTQLHGRIRHCGGLS